MLFVCVGIETSVWGDGGESVVNMVINLSAPYNAGNFLKIWVILGFFRMTLSHGVG